MNHCNIGDEGVMILAEALCKNSALRELDLSHNRLHDAGIESLCKMVYFMIIRMHIDVKS